MRSISAGSRDASTVQTSIRTGDSVASTVRSLVGAGCARSRFARSQGIGWPTVGLFHPTARLCRELTQVFPERPFSIEFWDGGRVPATEARTPTFFVRRASAIAHALRAPGPLGLGRAYVEGSLETDDIDAAFVVVDDWVPPPITRRDKARLLGALVLAALPAGIPRRPSTELLLPGARRAGDSLPLRRRQRLLRAVSRRVDDLQLCPVLTRCGNTRGGPARQARYGRQEARAARRATRAGCRMRLGQLCDPRRARLRRQRRGDHAVAVTGRAGSQAGRRCRRRRSRRDPHRRLPRGCRRGLRRDREHRHG